MSFLLLCNYGSSISQYFGLFLNLLFISDLVLSKFFFLRLPYPLLPLHLVLNSKDSIILHEGNTRLCGKPLNYICPGDESADHVQPSLDESEVDVAAKTRDGSIFVQYLVLAVLCGALLEL